MKTCPKCKEVKDLDAFYMSKSTGKILNYCKACYSSYSRNRYVNDSTRILNRNRDWAKANQDTDKERRKFYNIKWKYGLSPNEYDTLPKECAICGSTERLAVDHNHTTGEIRGILCGKHNMALGLFDDDTTLLLRAVDYLMGVFATKIRCSINERLAKDMGISGRKRSQTPM